jgi:DNA-binding NarL/FixJ family response regulator
MKKLIRVMLIEDHPEYREVVEAALRKSQDMDLIGQFGTAERALLHLKDHHRSKEPEIILLDLNLPGMHGLDAIPLINAACPNAKVVILTQSDKEAEVLKAISLGAAGYLLKSSSVSQITESIRAVRDGGAPLDAGVARFLLSNLKSALPKRKTDIVLSSRETEILTLLAEGMQKKEIADRLQISTTTVVTHVNHIYQKLNVVNAPSAINQAHRLGLFPTDESRHG